MATLVLTAVGTAIGGPIGGALGALAGQAIDAKLLAPTGREGPRLTELAVQTSSYGTPIPKIFGTMRVAGTVIWSTDLIEHAAREGGGKGRAATTRYTYSASFAVLLSARAIRSVGRIWADGTLLRGATGELKVATGFRLYPGDEDQQPDPLIASAEGIGLAPGWRGHAYAVFEDMALADFGNRIPSLTFEVVGDPDPVTCGAIIDAVAGGAIAGDEATTTLVGYSAYGDTIRSVTDGLMTASGAWIAVTGKGLTLRSGSGAAVTLEDRGAGNGGRGTRSIAAADTAPRTVMIQHYDPAREYQAGAQRMRRVGAGLRDLRIDLPAALEASAAKTLAGAALVRADLARERRTMSLDWRAMAVAPGDRVTIAGEAGLWRVADWSLETMILSLDLVRIARAPMPAMASAGRVIAAPDLMIGTTVVHAFEMPPIDDALLTVPRLSIAAAGTGAGWRSAAVQLSLDGGARWEPVGVTRARATLGWLATALAPAPATLVDRRNTVDIVLAHAGMTVSDADPEAIDRGANMAILGDELVQFGHAEPLAPGLWRLSELWRGRRGTEWAAGQASIGDRFVLLDPATVSGVDLPASAIGGIATVMAAGIGDDVGTATAAVSGSSIAPPSPVHVVGRVAADGTLVMDWVRRSRAGWRWIDRIDAAVAEEAELYAIDVDGTGATTVAEPYAVLAAGSWEPGDAITLSQVGTHARSMPVRPGIA